MKEFTIRKLKNIVISVLAVMLLASATFLVLNNKRVAFAVSQTADQTSLFLPNSKLEHYALSNPSDVYSDDTLTAIIQNDTLVLNILGEWKEPITNFQNLKQVKKLDNSTLLVSDDGSLYSINLNASPIAKTLLMHEGNPIGGNYFDVNNGYFVTAYNNKATVYSVGENLAISKEGDFGDIDADRPISLNKNGQIFYVSTSDKLCMRAIGNLKSIEEIDTDNNNSVPNKMIANSEYIYYVLNSDANVHRIKISTKERSTLSVKAPNEKYSLDRYELGNISTSPTGISFKGENLLVSVYGTPTTSNPIPENNTIQEFAIANDNLVFTGFAIAKGKTAYNRIGSSAIDVEKYQDRLAVLDNYKLTVMDLANGFDGYSPKNYEDYLTASELGAPDTFALGKDTVLLSYKHDTSASVLKILNLKDRAMSEELKVFDGNIIRDMCYQSGKYYVLADDGESRKVYTFTEDGLNFNVQSIMESLEMATQIHVDVFKNVYLLNGNKILKYSLADNYQVATETNLTDTKTVIKLNSDLLGKLYALTINNLDVQEVLVIDNGVQKLTLQGASIDTSSVAVSFAFDFIDSDVYLAYNSQEFIYKTNSLTNLSLSSLTVPDTYVTTDSTADFEKLEVYKPSSSANVYSVTKNESKFDFNGLVTGVTEYVLITKVNTDENGNTPKLLALAGLDGVVLVYENECTPVTIETVDAPEKAYITTAVHMYYFPIPTANDGYALSNTAKIRLAKETEISPLKEFTLLDNTYYYASVTIDGTEHFGYVHKNFTVEVLSERLEWNDYRLEKVVATKVYTDNKLTTSASELKNGQEVRILKQEGAIYQIAYKVNEDWVVGYISAYAIQNPANIAVRNILIILAVTACACGTTTYFLLRRKKNK